MSTAVAVGAFCAAALWPGPLCFALVVVLPRRAGLWIAMAVAAAMVLAAAALTLRFSGWISLSWLWLSLQVVAVGSATFGVYSGATVSLVAGPDDDTDEGFGGGDDDDDPEPPWWPGFDRARASWELDRDPVAA